MRLKCTFSSSTKHARVFYSPRVIIVVISYLNNLLRDTASGVWCVDSASNDGMSDGTGSAQFGRVDSGSWEKDISQLVFMKSGIPPPSCSEATSFWKLQNSTETDLACSSGMFESTDAANSSLPGPSSGCTSAATSNISRKSDSAPAEPCAMESPEHLLLEREVPARAFRSACVDSGSSVASLLEPRDRNSSATEFRSSTGTDLQVVCRHVHFQNLLHAHHTPITSGPHEYDECQRAHEHRQLHYS